MGFFFTITSIQPKVYFLRSGTVSWLSDEPLCCALEELRRDLISAYTRKKAATAVSTSTTIFERSNCHLISGTNENVLFGYVASAE